MRHSLKTGLSFGLTSGIITTIGLMVGLNSGTHSKLVVIGGIDISFRTINGKSNKNSSIVSEQNQDCDDVNLLYLLSSPHSHNSLLSF